MTCPNLAPINRHALWIVCALGPALMISGCEPQPTARSLKNEPSQFRIKADAPDSRFEVAGNSAGVATDGLESSFGEPSGPSTTFRAAEIAPENLVAAKALTAELGARQMPDHSISFDLPSDVLFDFDRATLRPDARSALLKASALITNYPKAPLAVHGHTDAKGTDGYNDPLSKRRAAAVAAWLKSETGRTAQAEGFGKRRPIAPNAHPDGSDDPEGRQRNRRVEILIRPMPSAP